MSKSEFDNLSKLYQDLFGEVPPVHEYMMDVTPDEARQMIRDALERGTPITLDDYPKPSDPSLLY